MCCLPLVLIDDGSDFTLPRVLPCSGITIKRIDPDPENPLPNCYVKTPDGLKFDTGTEEEIMYNNQVFRFMQAPNGTYYFV